MSRTIRMPRAAPGSDPVAAINALAAEIERQLATSPSGRAYSVTGSTGARALDVASATTGDVGAVLASLIGDLQAGGQIA